MLIMFSSVAIPNITQAETFKELTFEAVPNLTARPNITKKARDKCFRQALVGARAFVNARAGVLVEEQLKVWDKFALSDAAKKFTRTELLKIREIIIQAWILEEKYPKITPNDFGDFIYGMCLKESHSDTFKF